eukprot:1195255-Prorocentrum_minimum.AAC.8
MRLNKWCEEWTDARSNPTVPNGNPVGGWVGGKYDKENQPTNHLQPIYGFERMGKKPGKFQLLCYKGRN